MSSSEDEREFSRLIRTARSWTGPSERVLPERMLAVNDAKLRIANGKHFGARRIAMEIDHVRKCILRQQRWPNLRPKLDRRDPLIRLVQTLQAHLTELALKTPAELREVAKFYLKLNDSGAIDPRATAIVQAYRFCPVSPPTITEIRRAFYGLFGGDGRKRGLIGKGKWHRESSVKKTLLSLNLPIRAAKRGAPKGSRSK
jgi:hypothetical protein